MPLLGHRTLSFFPRPCGLSFLYAQGRALCLLEPKANSKANSKASSKGISKANSKTASKANSKAAILHSKDSNGAGVRNKHLTEQLIQYKYNAGTMCSTVTETRLTTPVQKSCPGRERERVVC